MSHAKTLAQACGVPVEGGDEDATAAVSAYVQRLQGVARKLVGELSIAGLAMQEMENLIAAVEARDPRRIVRTPGRRYLTAGSFDAVLLSIKHEWAARRHEVFVIFSFQIEKSSSPQLLIDDRVEWAIALKSAQAIEMLEAHARALESDPVRDMVHIAVEQARGRCEPVDNRIEMRVPVQLDVKECSLAVDPSKRAPLILKMRRRT